MRPVTAVPSDEIHEKYLQKAISEINELGDEIARAAGGGPAEAAAIDDDARSERSATEEIELVDPFELPTWREDG